MTRQSAGRDLLGRVGSQSVEGGTARTRCRLGEISCNRCARIQGRAEVMPKSGGTLLALFGIAVVPNRLDAALIAVPRSAFDGMELAPGTPGGTERSTPAHVIETMLRGLGLVGTERALCIGCGVGYAVALLSHLASDVHAIELEALLLEPQLLTLAQLGRTNVNMVHADAVRGKHAPAPFDAILVTCAAPELPPALIEQLAVGGRIVIPLGDDRGQLIELLEKRFDTMVSRTLGVCTVPLLPSLRRTPSTFPWNVRRDSGRLVIRNEGPRSDRAEPPCAPDTARMPRRRRH